MVIKEHLIQHFDDSNQRMEMLANRMDRDLEIYPGRTINASFRFNQIYQEWQHTHEQLKIAIPDMSPEKMEGNSSSLGDKRNHQRFGHWTHQGT